MSNAVSLTKETFNELITEAKGVALVDFWAEWCGPCRMLAPTIDEISADFAGRAGVYKVNVDNEGELAAQFGVMTIPTLFIFKDGAIADKIVGVVPKAQIAAAIEAVL